MSFNIEKMLEGITKSFDAKSKEAKQKEKEFIKTLKQQKKTDGFIPMNLETLMTLSSFFYEKIPRDTLYLVEGTLGDFYDNGREDGLSCFTLITERKKHEVYCINEVFYTQNRLINNLILSRNKDKKISFKAHLKKNLDVYRLGVQNIIKEKYK